MIVRVKGNHCQLQNPTNGRRAAVPFHGGDISRATLRSIISQSGLTTDGFLNLL